MGPAVDTVDAPLATARFGDVSVEIEGASRGDHIFEIIASTGGFYEAALLSSVRHLLRPGDAVIDVGANIGNHALFWGAVCQADVLAIEPDEALFATLRRNVARNALTARVFVRNFGLGAEDGRGLTVPGPEGNAGATRLVADGSGDVVILTLDELPEIADVPVRLIKVDVEEMELEVLRGAAATIARDLPVLVVECADHAALERVRGFLSTWSYAMVDCFNATPTCVFVADAWAYPPTYSPEAHGRDTLGRLAWEMIALTNKVNMINRARS